MVFALFEQCRLVAHQPTDCELHDALSEAVGRWLDFHCAPRKREPEPRRASPRSITRSA